MSAPHFVLTNFYQLRDVASCKAFLFSRLLQGSPDPLDSAFRLTYNMVLNLLRVEEINPEYMLEKSFYQFQHYTAIPEKMKSMQHFCGYKVALITNAIFLSFAAHLSVMKLRDFKTFTC